MYLKPFGAFSKIPSVISQSLVLWSFLNHNQIGNA